MMPSGPQKVRRVPRYGAALCEGRSPSRIRRASAENGAAWGRELEPKHSIRMVSPQVGTRKVRRECGHPHASTCRWNSEHEKSKEVSTCGTAQNGGSELCGESVVAAMGDGFHSEALIKVNTLTVMEARYLSVCHVSY